MKWIVVVFGLLFALALLLASCSPSSSSFYDRSLADALRPYFDQYGYKFEVEFTEPFKFRFMWEVIWVEVTFDKFEGYRVNNLGFRSKK